MFVPAFFHVIFGPDGLHVLTFFHRLAGGGLCAYAHVLIIQEALEVTKLPQALFVNEFRSMLSDKLLSAPGHDTEREATMLRNVK